MEDIMKKKEPKVIKAKDIMSIMDVCERTARRILVKVKRHNNKTQNQVVTFAEFYNFVGINLMLFLLVMRASP